MSNKAKRTLRIVAIVLASVLLVGLCTAVIYQLNGGDLATWGANFREAFGIPAIPSV